MQRSNTPHPRKRLVDADALLTELRESDGE